ncbi:MAG: hypothetical protein KGZ88_16090 [Methylomicrobium sp.]|nr:hypothetical protein [Methylomicrobium sp.]
MHTKLPFDTTKPVVGEASIEINKSIEQVFDFIGENFFDNYQKWALEVVDFEPLNGKQVFVGARAKQVRMENGVEVESVFEIIDFKPSIKIIFQGVTAPYKQCFLLETSIKENPTRLTFRFELLELEFFMRPFQKLIRIAIEDGAENTVENIKNLLINQSH